MRYRVAFKSPKYIDEETHLKVFRIAYASVKAKLFRQSMRPMSLTVQVAYNGEDFRNNLQSTIMDISCYKMPRIVKRMLQKTL